MTTPATPNVRDIGLSIIRTGVPYLWGWAMTWLVTQIPALEPILNESGMTGLGAGIAAALGLLWYALFRNIERRLPAWLTVLVLGSNSPPTYVNATSMVIREEPYRPGGLGL